VRGTVAGAVIDQAVGANEFVPLIRVIDGRMAFLCRNDALPTEGDVIGLAAPALQQKLDAASNAESASHG